MIRFRSIVVFGGLTAIGMAAHAADVGQPSQASASSARTRAEVKAETLRAIAAGEVSIGDITYPMTPMRPKPTFGRSRADVKAETKHALAAHEIASGDAAYPPEATSSERVATRAAGKVELARAIAAHEIHVGDVAYPSELPETTPRTKTRVHAMALAPIPSQR